MNKNEITIEDLAQMVQKGFDETNRNMDKRFAQVDKQFAEMHHELKGVRRDMLDVVYQPEFDDLKDRVVELENTTLRKKAA
ncbi:MAG TPA: hypothetical protein PLF16_00180 [Candidatus Staskawiczbacteria bacterium]|nr:hypothetical protein [Candidatus Staskawiczbacteria bacterium]